MGCCGGKDLKEQFEDIDVDLTELDKILAKYKDQAGSLITILQKAQEEYGYLAVSMLDYIAKVTKVKSAKVYGVATFYTQFRLQPVGKYLIMVCQGTACHVNGSKTVEQAVLEELGVPEGETTEDGLFTLNNVACLGCCSLSPVMMINDETYGNLTPKKTKKIIQDIRKQESEAKEA
ncbi:MAG TPA: NADH-quinone oxidoreductase subunit NuoE [Eubacteriaceae bacterium]|nr:NADH-quinone oxidoreductase subunit NuoE [Eubacteriaceae bacterium]